MSENYIVELHNVQKEYYHPVTKVFHNITCKILYGQTIAIVGQSGSGKSTLLNLIAGFDIPTTGEVFCYGKNLADFTEKELCEFRNQKLGFIFQSHHLLPQCTALENVLLPTLALKNSASKKDYDRAKELLNTVGLSQHWQHYPDQLSGGECQRVAVVRAILHNPSLVLADEPTGALDQETAEQIIELLLQLQQQYKMTLILVTHCLDYAAKMSQTWQISKRELLK